MNVLDRHDETDYEAQREALVSRIEAEMRDYGRFCVHTELDKRVAAAMRAVPRHEFLPPEKRSIAYVDHAQSIGHGQTISQPFVVAMMSDLLSLDPEDVVLEVGTGSGYQCAVLAELAQRVYSVELVDQLAHTARNRLRRLGYHNVEVRQGDGSKGWPEHAPFDKIIVTAASEEVPAALFAQLRVGGLLIAPLGPMWDTQWLTLFKKHQQGRLSRLRLSPVVFVPLLHSTSEQV